MKLSGFILLLLITTQNLKAQPGACIFKPSNPTIHFGSGMIPDPNDISLVTYGRVKHPCPSDGHYSFVPSTRECFRGDWHTLTEDHTPGDQNGNMMIVNAAHFGGPFLDIPITGLKSNTSYELGMWLMNLCRPTDKCPSLLLPNLKIMIKTPEGRQIAHIVTRDLPRTAQPRWNQHRVLFTTPENTSNLQLLMMDNAPGGCGNDFALDDITFRECVKQDVQRREPPKSKPVAKTSPSKLRKASSPPAKPKPAPTQIQVTVKPVEIEELKKINFPNAPAILRNRENALVRRIETTAGEIKIDLYDNGVIDGDTVSVYHNNSLIKSRQGLSQKPISISIQIDPTQPHHELTMVAENLGTIPPNTSIMIITTPENRYRVSISSSIQKNARVVFDLLDP